jgi:hypothetical protein
MHAHRFGTRNSLRHRTYGDYRVRTDIRTDMGQPEKPRIEELADELEWWRVYREIHQKKDFDIVQFYSDLAIKVQRKFVPQTTREFARLCRAGCLAEGLALSVAILRFSPDLQRAWVDLVGPADNRPNKAKALQRAAKTLDFVYGNILPLGWVVLQKTFGSFGPLPAPLLSLELAEHARFIMLAERLSQETETHSLVEFSKYFLTSYVKRMTGDFHDRSVSALVGEVVGPEDYSATAQSQWRFRNYERLDHHHAGLVKLAVAMSVVIAHTA